VTPAERRAKRAEAERKRRAAETPEQREVRLAKRRARYSDAPWREKHRNDCRVYYSKNKDNFKTYERKRRAKQETKDYDLVRSRRRHGIKNATAERRSGPCEICAESVESLKLDHWHTGLREGEPRGWLCNSCNLASGAFKDSADLLEKAAAYHRFKEGLDIGQPAV